MLSSKALELANMIAADSAEDTERVLDKLENDAELYSELEPLLVLYSHPVNSTTRLDRSIIAQYLELFMSAEDYSKRFESLQIFEMLAGSDEVYENIRAGNFDPDARAFLDLRYDYFKDVMSYHPHFQALCKQFYEFKYPLKEGELEFLKFGLIAYPKTNANVSILHPMMNEIVRLCDTYQDTTFFGEFLEYVDALLKCLPPENHAALLVFSGTKVIRHLKDFEEEARRYRLALEIDDSNLNAKNNLAYNLVMGGGNAQEALLLAKEAVEGNRDSKGYRHTLGKVYEAVGEYSQAKATYETAIKQLGYYDATDASLRKLLSDHPELQ